MPHSNDIGYLLKLLNDKVRLRADEIFTPLGITISQSRVIEYVYDRGELKTCQKDIEEYLDVSHPTVIGLLKRLEAKGLLVILPDESDRRQKIVTITEEARKLNRYISQNRNAIEDDLLRGVGEESRKELERMLRLLYRNIASS